MEPTDTSTASEPRPDASPVDSGPEKPQPPATDVFALPAAPRGRGRPAKSEAEKAVTKLDHALRLAAGAGVPADILAKYQTARDDISKAAPTITTTAKPTTPGSPSTTAKKPPTKEQREKLNRALTKTFSFIGEAVYEVTCKGTAPNFPDERAKDLADAWEDIVAEHLPENGASVLGWGIAIASTGQTVVASAREIKAHNEREKSKSEK